MRPELVDAILEAIEGATKPLHERIKELEAKSGDAGTARIEARIQAIEKALGLESRT